MAQRLEITFFKIKHYEKSIDAFNCSSGNFVLH